MRPTLPDVLDGVRWDCGGCTDCCRHFALGPVADSIIEGLEARGVREAWPAAAHGFAVRRPGPDGKPSWYLTRRADGACVFLQEDGLCAVHARWGPAVKPAFCQEYPFVVLDLDHATRVAIRSDCGGWAESFTTGPLVADAAAAVEALPRVHPKGRFTLDPVEVLPGVGVGRSSWATVEAAVDGALHPGRTPPDQVGAAADALYRLVGRPRPAREPTRARAATAAAAAAIRGALADAVSRPPAQDAETRGMVTFLASVVDLLDAGAPRLDAPGPWDPSAREFLSIAFRSELFGLGFQPWGGLPAWLAGMALGASVARAASEDGSARSVGPHFATFVRFTRHVAAHRLLGHLRPTLLDLFVHVGVPDHVPG